MKLCQYCNHEMSDYDSICPYCGIADERFSKCEAEDNYGIICLMLGIFAILTCWCPISVFFAIPGLVFGDKAKEKTKSVDAGTVLSILGIILGIASPFIIMAIFGYF